MIAAIYARKSTHQNDVADDQKSVFRQVEHARAYAQSKGWAVAEDHVYVDDGISGAEFAARPGFLKLMNALKPKPPFQALVMSEESRLGREQIETSYALKQIVQAGVEVWFYLEDRQRPLNSPTDKIMFSLIAFADELEREKARQRVTDAMVRKARAGHVTGGRCFGYDNVEILGPEGSRSHVERRIKEAEAEVVREIFELCAQGHGLRRIAHQLNDHGVPSPRAQQGRPRGWAPSSVRAVLNRETYRGVVVWNKSKKRDAWGQHKQKPRPEAEWIRTEAPELRIVSDEQWEAAQDRLAATRATYLRQHNGRLWGRPLDPTGRGSRYLLIGLARCAHCGGGLEMRSRSHGPKAKRAKFYSCSSHYRKGKAICPNKYEIPMPAADAAVIETLLAEILTPERLQQVAERAVEMARAEREATPKHRAELDRQLREADKALERLTDAVASGGGDVPALVEAMKDKDAQRSAIASRLSVLDTPPVAFDAQLEAKLTKAVEEWRTILGGQVPLARQIVSKLLTEKIIFAPEDRDGRRGFRFQATGTVEKLLAGRVPGRFPAVVSPTGFEPVLPA